MRYSTLKIFIVFSIGLISGISYSQTNLVLNPSLEDHSQCPDNPDQIDYAIGWYLFRISPDYYNVCAINPDFLVPNNNLGFQNASSGFAYGGLITYASGLIWPNAREYAGGSLSTPLTIGTKYFVSFKISPSFNSVNMCNCVTNNLGVNFSTDTIPSELFPITNTAKVNTTSIISDTSGWTQVFGSFISDSSYQYIVIGNFFDDNNTDTMIIDTSTQCKFGYYYFDDVCVSTDSSFAFNYIGISDNENIDFIKILPNPVIDFLEINNTSSALCEYLIYDDLGQITTKGTLESTEKKLIDLTTVQPGIYCIYIYQNKHYLIKKIVKL